MKTWKRTVADPLKDFGVGVADTVGLGEPVRGAFGETRMQREQRRMERSEAQAEQRLAERQELERQTARSQEGTQAEISADIGRLQAGQLTEPTGDFGIESGIGGVAPTSDMFGSMRKRLRR